MIAARDDWPGWAHADRAMAIQERRFQDVIDLEAAMFKRSAGNEKAISEQRNWVWERDDWEQFELAMREQRYADAKRLHATMLSQQSDLKQQLVLAIKEKRWLDAAHFCEAISV
jgi:hypothetical protein